MKSINLNNKMRYILQYFTKKIEKNNIIFFDLDGTLVDTNYSNYLSYIKAIKFLFGNNIKMNYNPEERFTRKSLIKIFPTNTNSEIEIIIQLKENFFLNYLQETKINHFTVAILMRYFGINKTVLVTNCRKKRANAILKYHKIDKLFTNIFYRAINDCECCDNKYERAIAGLKANPLSIIAFENEKIEICKAVSAGISLKNIWRIMR